MEHKDYLWYIIPGTLFLLPLIKAGSLPNSTGGLEIVTFIVLAFVAGYIIHSIYRIIYRYVFFAHRPLIRFLKNKLKEMDISISGTQADYLYNYYIYSNTKFSSQISQIRNRSQASSSIFSCMLGAIFGFVLNLFYVGESLFYYIYAFIIPLLGLNYYITFWRWLNGDEKTLLGLNFDTEFKSRKNEIEKILEEIK